MTGRLDDIVRRFQPPGGAIAAPPWETSESDAGLGFPGDYRRFAETYGGGFIASPDSLRMYIRTPSVEPRWEGLPGGFAGFVDWHRSSITTRFEGWDPKEWGGTAYPMFPEPGGLLAWGEDEEGDVYWWLTEGEDPDEWPVVVWERGPATTTRYEFGMVELLHRMITGRCPGPSMLRSRESVWTTTNDWLRRGIEVSAG